MNGQVAGSSTERNGVGGARLESVNSPIPSQMDGCESAAVAVDTLLETLEKRLGPYMSTAVPETGGNSSAEGVGNFHTRLVMHHEHLIRVRDRIHGLLDRLAL